MRCTLVRSLMAISLGLFSDLCEDKIWPLISFWYKQPWKFMKSINRLKSKCLLGFGQRVAGPKFRQETSERVKFTRRVRILSSHVSRAERVFRALFCLSSKFGSPLSLIGFWREAKTWNTKITLRAKETHSTKCANQTWDILVGGKYCSQQSTDCLLIIIIAVRDLCKARNVFNLT